MTFKSGDIVRYVTPWRERENWNQVGGEYRVVNLLSRAEGVVIECPAQATKGQRAIPTEIAEDHLKIVGCGKTMCLRPDCLDCYPTQPWPAPKDVNHPVFDKPDPKADHIADAVNNPAHYELLSLEDLKAIVDEGRGLEVVDVIRAKLTPEEYRGWCKGNGIKYRLRCDDKGKPIEDRRKASKMLNWEIEVLGEF